jgi:hypothetical protein
MGSAPVACGACGTEPIRDGARFCDVCGAPTATTPEPAEYKQVTVLFADVVRSMAPPIVDTQTAKEKARIGDLDGAIALSQAIVDDQFDTGEMIYRGPAVTVLVESLLQRGAADDVQTAQEVIDRLAAVPTDPGFVLHEIPLLRLRALVARQGGDQTGYRDWVDRYRATATTCGFQGHMAIAEAMRCP